MAYPVVGRDALATVFGMGQACVGQVIDSIQFGRCHRGIGRIDHHMAVAYLLHDTRGVELVRLFFDMLEIFCLCPLVAKAGFVRVEHHIGSGDASWNVGLGTEKHRLGALQQVVAEGSDGLLAHAVDDEVGTRVAQDAGTQGVLPIVVVGDTAQRSLNAAKHHGSVGVELLENAAIHDGGIFWAAIVTSVGTIGILRAQPLVGSVFVDHGIHAPRCHAKEEARLAQFLEVAVVAVPVGLRHNGHLEPQCLDGASDDGCTERGMIDIGIGREENHVERVPSPQLHLLLGGG